MQTAKKNKKNKSISEKRKKKALGRGLDSLIPDIESIDNSPNEYFMCDIEQIRPNRYQPRIKFNEDELRELSKSIKEQGIIQPLLVRNDADGYELIAGERRLRAAKIAEFARVPVVVKNITDSELLAISIVENIQREDLNPMEQAEAYYLLIKEFNITQEEVAKRVAKSRSSVANFLRLRQLPEPIKTSIREGKVSMGHARALLGAETSALQNAAWQAVISKGLSVRETEALIKRMKSKKKEPEKPVASSEEIYFSSLSEALSRQFGTRVQIKRKGQKGKVEIDFYSNDDLDRLITFFKQL